MARVRLEGLSARLEGASYAAVLARGFVLVRDAAGHPPTCAAEVKPGQAMSLRFADGEVPAIAAGGRGGGRRPSLPPGQGEPVVTVPRRASLALPALLRPRRAGALAVPATSAQGAFHVGEGADGLVLALDGRPLRVSPSGRFAFAFHREHGPEARLQLRRAGREEERVIRVQPRDWPVQRIDGLPPAMVTPDADTLARIRAEAMRVAAIRRQDSAAEGFAEPPIWPAEGRISGVFGSQRILNGEPRAPHLGIDIAVPTGTPVRAALSGRVVLAAELYFNGLTPDP